jgi:hypothetical protein
MLLATSLVVTLFPEEISTGLFGKGDIPDAVQGATVGSISARHPLTGYLLGGELLSGGISLIAVTALLITWVAVGIVQLPIAPDDLLLWIKLYVSIVFVPGSLLGY